MKNKDIFTEVAKQCNTNSDDVKKEMQEAIDMAFASDDPEIRKFWESIPRKSDKLTPEEAVNFIAGEIMKKRHLS